MTGMWYNGIVGVATHLNAVSGDQGMIKTDPMGAAPFSIYKGARQSPVSLIAERGRAR